MTSYRTSPRQAALPALLLLTGVLLAARPAAASTTTLTFDNLASEPGVAGDVFFPGANGGSRTVSGVTFNAAANSDWEIIGNQYVPDPAFSLDPFGQSHSGDYFLAGNAYSGMDFFGDTFTGLTISTDQLLQSVYVGYDDNGGVANDADTLTITAYGAGGDLASDTTTLNGPALSLLDTSGAFGGLIGVTGYRFETTASNQVYGDAGQAYVIADDLTFAPAVPEASTTISFGLLLALGLGGLIASRKKTAKAKL